MKQVKNGEIVAQRLPRTGTINGATVMNYHKLPQETLIAEGWLPVEEVKPDYNVETERLRLDSEVVEAGRVLATYAIEAIPEPVITPTISNITLTADKTQITADGTDAATITATFDGVEVDTFVSYITIDGEVCETVEPITGGEVVREFTSAVAKVFKIDFYAGGLSKTIFVGAV